MAERLTDEDRVKHCAAVVKHHDYWCRQRGSRVVLIEDCRSPVCLAARAAFAEIDALRAEVEGLSRALEQTLNERDAAHDALAERGLNV